MKTYLVQFTYDHWCQGYEDATVMVLVYAASFDIAAIKIAKNYNGAREFHNLTLE